MAQELVMEALKYHLLPERRPLLQSGRTKPRKATVGTLLAVGGMDANKGNSLYKKLFIISIIIKINIMQKRYNFQVLHP